MDVKSKEMANIKTTIVNSNKGTEQNMINVNSDDKAESSQHVPSINEIVRKIKAVAEKLESHRPKKLKRNVIKVAPSLFRRDSVYFKNPRRSKRLNSRPSSDGDIDSSVSDREEIEEVNFSPRRKKRVSFYVPPPQTLPVEEITEEMISAIHKYGSKVYNSASGVMCHQCRQKTIDTKTMCRSGKCSGGRGAFCGPCLSNHYGESVEDALKNPNWSCPPCRNICICSFHMKERGMAPAGIVTPHARRLGYKSVLEYLVDKEIIKVGEDGIVDI